jgi:hypothetical protein
VECHRCGRVLSSRVYFDAPGVCKVCFEDLTPEQRRDAVLARPGGRVAGRVDEVSALLSLLFIPGSWMLFDSQGLLQHWWIWVVLLLGWYGLGVFLLAPRRLIVSHSEVTIFWWWRPRRTNSLVGVWPFSRSEEIASRLQGCDILVSPDGETRLKFWPETFRNYPALARALGVEPAPPNGRFAFINSLLEERRKRAIRRVPTAADTRGEQSKTR